MQRDDFIDRTIRNGDAECFRLQTTSFAIRAFRRRHEALDLFANLVGIRFVIAALQHRHDAFICAAVGVRARFALERELHLLFGAEEDAVARFFRQLVPRRVEREFLMLRDCGDLFEAPVLRAQSVVGAGPRVGARRHALGLHILALLEAHPRELLPQARVARLDA